ncbi:MAG: carboxypeptidase regulatory-like domain-containing protein [Acidobacteria bacterium]|nr:carboxypeptidase regulatory-like domain-containing protein [Acidobacteriota bacterium]
MMPLSRHPKLVAAIAALFIVIIFSLLFLLKERDYYPSKVFQPKASSNESVLFPSTKPADVVSIRGRITNQQCPAVKPANVSVTLDNEHSAVVNDQGWYELRNVKLNVVTGIPTGNHFLVVTATGFRTKIVRFTTDSDNKLNLDSRQEEPTRTSLVIDFNLHSILASDCQTEQAGREANNAIDAVDSVHNTLDEDQDGIDDLTEDWLTQRFAPIVYHGQRESNYPVSVDWLLARTSLNAYDSTTSERVSLATSVKLNNQAELLNKEFATGPRGGQNISSNLTRSFCKQTTYFLNNVKVQDQIGEPDRPQDWITYVHTYPNKSGGVTLQYWRCYSYNDASFLSFDFSHGGDWESIAVHLDSALKPMTVAFLGHTGIEYHLGDVQWEGEHPKVWVQEGGHSSYPDSKALKSSKFTRQETWTGGQAILWDGTPLGDSGGLLNMGEKTRPRNGQLFVQYSGLWGSPAQLFITSGYWGPAFNETDSRCANGQQVYSSTPTCSADMAHCERIFHKAWCDGMNGQLQNINVECYATSHSP